MSDDDPQAELSALNARGRKKAVRRAIKTVVSILPAMVLWVALTPFFGWILACVGAVVVGAVITVALEKLLPGDDPTLED